MSVSFTDYLQQEKEGRKNRCDSDFKPNFDFRSNSDFKPDCKRDNGITCLAPTAICLHFPKHQIHTIQLHFPNTKDPKQDTLRIILIQTQSKHPNVGSHNKWTLFVISQYFTLFQEGSGGGSGGCAPFLQFPVKYFYFHLLRSPTSLDLKRQIVRVSSFESGAAQILRERRELSDQLKMSPINR